VITELAVERPPLALTRVEVRTQQTGDEAGPLGRAVDTLLAALLIGQLLVTFANVVLRAVSQTSIDWANETADFVLPAIAFLGGAVAYARNRHMAFKLVQQRLPPAAARVLDVLCDWIVLGLALVVIVVDLPSLPAQWAQASPMLGISLFWRALAVPAGMALLAAFAAARLWQKRDRTVLLTGAAFGAVVLALVLAHHATGSELHGAFPAAAALVVFALLAAIGLPIGFVLMTATGLFIALSGTASPAGLPERMLTGSDLFVLLALPFFILAGRVMEHGGISARLVRFVSTFVRHVHGGSLHVTIVSMFLFSGMSGSKSADMAAVGSVTTDMLRRAGYPRSENVAVLDATAVMGETIPPSIATLVVASITSVPLGALFAGGILPAVVIAVVLMILATVRSRRMGIPLESPATWRELGATALRALPPLLMPVILFGGIRSGLATPTEVSSLAAVYGIALAVIGYRSLGARAFVRMLAETTTMSGMVLFILACASGFTWALTIAYRPDQLMAAIAGAHLSVPAFMALSIVLIIVLGMLLEGLPALLIFAPLLLPVAAAMGIDPVYYAIVLIIAMGVGTHLPPIGVGYYIACAIGGTTAEESFKPALVYQMVALAGLVILAMFPAITTSLVDWLHLAR
jgi:tripartite ATP-independent transporter DctM subunit